MERFHHRAPSSTEGFRPEHIACVKTVAQLLWETHRVKTDCVIGFGSRAKGVAHADSDVDVLALLDFSEAAHSFYNKERMLSDARRGGASVYFPTDPPFHYQLLRTNHFIRALRLWPSQLIPENSVLQLTKEKQMLHQAQVLYGEEPKIKEEPLLAYIRRRFSKQ